MVHSTPVRMQILRSHSGLYDSGGGAGDLGLARAPGGSVVPSSLGNTELRSSPEGKR